MPIDRPVAVWISQGSNDGGGFTDAQYRAYLETVRAANPRAVLFAVCPFPITGPRREAIRQAVATLDDPRVVFLDDSDRFDRARDTSDGLHFNPGGAVRMAAWVAADVQSTLDALGGRGSPGFRLASSAEEFRRVLPP